MLTYAVYSGINVAIGFILIAIGYRLYYLAAFKNTKQSRTQLIKILPGMCFSVFGMVAIGVGLWTFFPAMLPAPEAPASQTPASPTKPPEVLPREVVLKLDGPLVVHQQPSLEARSTPARAASNVHSPIVTLRPPETTFAPSRQPVIPGRERSEDLVRLPPRHGT